MGKDAYIMVRFYGVHKAESITKKLYKEGKLSEKLYNALISEIENYF